MFEVAVGEVEVPDVEFEDACDGKVLRACVELSKEEFVVSFCEECNGTKICQAEDSHFDTVFNSTLTEVGEEEEEESESEESPEDYGQELEDIHDVELEEDSVDEKNETSGSDEDVFASGDSLINETLDEVILLKPMEYLDYDEVEE